MSDKNEVTPGHFGYSPWETIQRHYDLEDQVGMLLEERDWWRKRARAWHEVARRERERQHEVDGRGEPNEFVREQVVCELEASLKSLQEYCDWWRDKAEHYNRLWSDLVRHSLHER